MIDELTLLLVNIEGNLLENGATERDLKKNEPSEELSGYMNRFNEAFDFFSDEVALWSAETGVNLQLVHRIEGNEDVVSGVTVMRDTHTKVYAKFGEKTDRAFFKLHLGNLNPAFNVIKDSEDGIWKFQWRLE